MVVAGVHVGVVGVGEVRGIRTGRAVEVDVSCVEADDAGDHVREDVEFMRDHEHGRARGGEPAEHHHHLVCRDCGRTVEISVPASFESWSARVGADEGFTDLSHTVEIFGTCPTC